MADRAEFAPVDVMDDDLEFVIARIQTKLADRRIYMSSDLILAVMEAQSAVIETLCPGLNRLPSDPEAPTYHFPEAGENIPGAGGMH